jgi:hypothetical protein
MANSHGGCLVVGVAQRDDNSLHPVGLSTLTDKANIHKGVQKFIPAQLIYEVLDFSYTESEYPTIKGKKFQVMLVENTPQYIPFVTIADGDSIRNAAIYVRRGTSTEEATYHELQEMFNHRLETSYSSHQELALEEHFAILRTLYGQIKPYLVRSAVSTVLTDYFDSLLQIDYESNPDFPKETYEQFVAKLIEKKKKQIEELFNG